MKKLAIISALIICSCVINTSCFNSVCPDVERDESLTGSISYSCQAEIECTFDGVLLEENVPGNSGGGCEIRKISDNKVSLRCTYSIWGGERFIITIPELTVSGEPYDVKFDYVSKDGTVLYDDDYHAEEGADEEYETYDSVTISINGWMREKGIILPLTRCSPYMPGYNCDITIGCTIDGKELSLKIIGLQA